MHIDARDDTLSQTFCFVIGYPVHFCELPQNRKKVLKPTWELRLVFRVLCTLVGAWKVLDFPFYPSFFSSCPSVSILHFVAEEGHWSFEVGTFEFEAEFQKGKVLCFRVLASTVFILLLDLGVREIKNRVTENSTQWLDPNFIPMDSKKFGFRNFDYIIRFAIKNGSDIEKFRSCDQRIFENILRNWNFNFAFITYCIYVIMR